MFVTVQFGERQSEIFNLNCRIVSFVHRLKERCRVDPDEHIDLLDTTGELANLSERELSTDPAGSVLRDRHSYVLIRVTRSEGAVGCKYEPLLYDLDKSHPSLAERLRRLSKPHKERDRKGGPSRKGWLQKDSPTPHATRAPATPVSSRGTSGPIRR
ncbi:uncharacterized protein C22orf15 [Scleropages formosus]|uniref:uncharacterized protein C22orf15 n=1 Tax=Scleropages formosus TaxID=113540 RepID=UPI000878471E|nr:uncharacterized protein C22orf15 homolog [Scleropages formosus]